MFSPKISTLLMIWFVACIAGVLSLQCHVCVAKVNESPQVESQFPGVTLPVCQKGTLPPGRDCPALHTGCLTEFSGENFETIQRMCARTPITDCKEANNVMYCFCGGNLCNTKVEKDFTTTKLTTYTLIDYENNFEDETVATIVVIQHPRPTTTTTAQPPQGFSDARAAYPNPAMLILFISIMNPWRPNL